jgi:hypothetical protein
MSLCIACAVELPNAEALCPHHDTAFANDEWARWNRIVCDLIHRGIEPPPADAAPKAEEVSALMPSDFAACMETVA